MSALAIALLWGLPFSELVFGPRADPIATFPVSIAVVTVDGAPVADDAWIDAQLDFAETMFGDVGVHFRRVAAPPLAPRFAALETRADRDALAASLVPRTINVFVVASLRDVDEPSRMRMGVHWRERGHAERHFVVVAATARPSVLAHELGHFFGNGHSAVQDNVMSYDRSGGAVFFDDAQIRRIRALANGYLRSGEVEPLR